MHRALPGGASCFLLLMVLLVACGPSAGSQAGEIPTVIVNVEPTPTVYNADPVTGAEVFITPTPELSGVGEQPLPAQQQATPLPTGVAAQPPQAQPPLPDTPTPTPVPVVESFAQTGDGSVPPGKLAFTRSVRNPLNPNDPSPAGTACHIFVTNADGSAPVDLLPGSGACSSDPAFSPDGTRLAYVESRGGRGSNIIVVMSADGSQEISISAQAYFQTYGPLVWSTDGSNVAIYYPGDFAWHSHAAADGSEAGSFSRLAPDAWRIPGVSPDGRYRAEYCEVEPEGGLQRALCRVDLTTQDVVQLTPPVSEFGGSVTWSPDSKWLAFEGRDAAYNYGVYVVRVDGSGLALVGEGRDPAWMP